MLSEDARGLLYCLCIMEESGDLKNASWSTVACFCHIHTERMLEALAELKEKGCIYFNENKDSYRKFKVLEKGFEENKHYL